MTPIFFPSGILAIPFLPLDDKIDWKNHCIIVEKTDLKKAAKFIEQSINTMGEEEIINLQIANRKLWIENLSFSGFYYRFNRQIEKKYNKDQV